MKRRSALIASDFQSADVLCTAGQYTEFGRYVIGSGRYVTLGWGYLASQSDADGRIYFNPETTVAAAMTGTLLISVFTPEDRHFMDLFEDRTENLFTSATDRTKQLPFPETGEGYGKDWILKLFFKPDATGTIDFGTTELVMAITIESKN